MYIQSRKNKIANKNKNNGERGGGGGGNLT